MILSCRTGLLLSAVLTLGAGCATNRALPTVPLSQEALLGSWELTRVGSRPVRMTMSLNFRVKADPLRRTLSPNFSGPELVVRKL